MPEIGTAHFVVPRASSRTSSHTSRMARFRRGARQTLLRQPETSVPTYVFSNETLRPGSFLATTNPLNIM